MILPTDVPELSPIVRAIVSVVGALLFWVCARVIARFIISLDDKDPS